MKRIAVFFGGNSNEREISVITGVYAVNLLRGAGYEVFPILLSEKNELIYLPALKKVEDAMRAGEKIFPVSGGFSLERKPKKKFLLDCALNCCHGGLGEGGGLSALLAFYGIPSASPGVGESAIFLDKALSKIALAGLGIRTLPSLTLLETEPREECLARVESFGFPVIVKPALLGSSIGISVARDGEELAKSLKVAFSLCGKVVIEKYLENRRDLNCAAYRKGDEIVLSPVEEVFSSEPLLSFREKYESVERRSEIPAKISETAEEEIKKELRMLYEAFGIRGVVRADFLLSGEELYFNELNTVPGSLAAYLFGDGLLAAKEFLISLIEEGARREPEKELIKSGILSRIPSGAKLRK